jgi:hypothetical protein
MQGVPSDSVLAEVLQVPASPILYHYTSQAGLLGIVAKRVLWATNMAYLNDVSEYEYGRNVIRAALKKRQAGAPEKNQNFIEETKSVFESKARDFFLTALTEAGDLLSQWRGYTEDGNGFCLGFDSKVLDLRSDFNGEWLLTRCEYRHSRQRELADQLIDQWLRKWEEAEAAPEKLGFWDSFLGPTFEFHVSAQVLALSFKDPSYSEEREWRLVAQRSDTSTVRFRAGKSMVTPYLDIDLRSSKPEDAEVMLRSVIVGPCPYPVLAVDSVRMLLEANGHKEVEITNSAIPFRAW